MDTIGDLLTVRRLELDKLRVSAETFKGPCFKCRWFQSRAYGASVCRHPLLLATWLDPVQGVRAEHRSVDCGSARADSGICGVDGNLFEAARWWWRHRTGVMVWAVVLAIFVFSMWADVRVNIH